MITADRAREISDNSAVVKDTNKEAEKTLEYISDRIETIANNGYSEYIITIYDDAYALLNPENAEKTNGLVINGNMLRKIVVETLKQNGFYVENTIDNGKPVLVIRW